ncbi:WxL domain-containing protein [Candidatus Enterococcus ikei]|uniref:WxL domain-containing protein n=1 Tax=Candidatus Enterococcus ikei TaxID=2815326 RepID=A0ABS3GX74_9ENTE|nr:WxL domain-containing protein [Enterococcus sp. DIV0869a]MBO0439873.1 WxL domain-containing protein [Enterococcus sp. DIV0869a]
MKLTHKLCGAALLAVVGVAVAMPNATKADNGTATQYNGQGTVEFEDDTDASSDKPHIPGDSSELDLEPNPDKGPLKILGASPLQFDKSKIIEQGAADEMRDIPVNKYQDPSGVITENFVEFKDKRSDTLDHSYTVTAKLQKQFTHEVNTEGILKGAEIHYKTARIHSAFADDAYKPVGLETAFELAPAEDGKEPGAAVPVLKNSDSTKGTGYWDISFGDKTIEADAEGSAEQAVTLKVPKNLSLLKGKYSATILWEITAGVNP